MYNFKGIKEPVSVNPLEQWKVNQEVISKELYKYHAAKVLSVEQQNHLNQILELPLIDDMVVGDFRIKCRWRS